MVSAKHQALAYGILPVEEGAGKRCSECGCQLQLPVHVGVEWTCSVKKKNQQPFSLPGQVKVVLEWYRLDGCLDVSTSTYENGLLSTE